MIQSMSIKDLNYTLILIMLSTLSACSVFDDNYMMRVAPPEHYDELNEYIEEWKEAKPKVERISTIEYDLALIIDEVDELSKLKNLPFEYVDDNRSQMPKLPEEAKTVDLARHVFAAHLAFFLKEESAKGGWQVIKRRYPEILDGLTPVVKKIVRNEQTIYSLRVGPFELETEAHQICSIMNRHKYMCEQTTFSGITI